MQSTAPPGRQSRGEWETRARILQNMKSCRLSAPRSHEFQRRRVPGGSGGAAGGPGRPRPPRTWLPSEFTAAARARCNFPWPIVDF